MRNAGAIRLLFFIIHLYFVWYVHLSIRINTLLNVTLLLSIETLKKKNLFNLLFLCCLISLPYITSLALLVVKSSRGSISRITLDHSPLLHVTLLCQQLTLMIEVFWGGVQGLVFKVLGAVERAKILRNLENLWKAT